MGKSSKRGICVPWNFNANDFAIYQEAIDRGQILWLSNWEMWKPKGLPENIIYVPQCRTGNEAGQIPDYMNGYAKDGCLKYFLGFNEPDINSQASLSVEKAVELWKAHVLPLKNSYPELKIGSPAISNGPEGLKWLRQFLDCLEGPQKAMVDFICLHYYSPNVEDFKRYVTTAHKEFGLPVWVTEFACTRWDPANAPHEDEVCSFMEEALNFLDGAGFVERYAWFGAMEDVGDAVGKLNGLQKDGKLSVAGRIYCA